jgi:hypothetical protein
MSVNIQLLLHYTNFLITLLNGIGSVHVQDGKKTI